MESVQNDGEVNEIFEPMEVVGCTSEVSTSYLDLDSNKTASSEETSLMNELDDHLDKEVLLFNKKKQSFVCLICGKKFNQNAGRYNHMKKVHNVRCGDKTNIRCLEKGCSFRCSYKEKLQLHLVEEHGFSMDLTIQNFNSYSEFLRWKEEFEKQEKIRFVKKSGSRPREQGVRVVYFYCSRSGGPISQTHLKKLNGKRKSTIKSNHHCTASITCLELASGKVEVKVCATHYGHETDLQSLRLTQTDKIHIAEQLIKGVPRDVVLDNIRSSASSEVDRIHLITIKDVKNIEKAYRINSKGTTEVTTNLSSNIRNWVSLMGESEHTPVAHFEEDGSSDLVNYDFTLVIMTVGQIEMAKKYGQSKIFYIPTYSTNENKFLGYSTKIKNIPEIHVASLIVADSSNDAVPIAFMITTHICKDKYKLLFECVKRNVPKLEAKAVLTDDQKDIFEVWNVVFASDSGEKPCHLWSNRFVDKDWRDNLVAIPNEEIQESVYERLYSYLESPDEMTICSTLKDYVDTELLTNPLTIRFGHHFVSKYIGSEMLWAGCYGKKSVAVHAQLNMERLSNQIEEVVDRRHSDKRFVVSTVQDLLKLISDNQCHRQAKIHRQIQELPNHHKLALQINPEAISRESNTSWRVNSSKDPEKIFSIVKKQTEKCCNIQPCLLFCKKCGTCAHEFSCSCRLYAFDKTMCKHIHAVLINCFDQTHFLASQEDNIRSTGTNIAQLQHEHFWGRRRKKKLDPPAKNSSDLIVKEEDECLPPVDGTESACNNQADLPSNEKEKPQIAVGKRKARGGKPDLPTKKEEKLSATVDGSVPIKTSSVVEADLPGEEEKTPSPALDAPVLSKKARGVMRQRGRPKRNLNQENEKMSKDQDSLVEESEKPHRLKVNILRKSKRTRSRNLTKGGTN